MRNEGTDTVDLLTGVTALATANSLILGFIAYTMGRQLDALDYVGLLWVWVIVGAVGMIRWRNAGRGINS